MTFIESVADYSKLHNEEFYNLYSSTNIIRQIKSRELSGRGMWHAWERREKCIRFWSENPERVHSKD
jgi:hypothetical protein